ncbi:MAG TPA: hypothetical protein VG675_09215 [Bryobacteraceae bacterium]|nr:hypothetical protein [Bryobacteraceae bacterium]
MTWRLMAFGLLGAAGLLAQEIPLTSVRVNFPPDSPVTLLSTSMGQSRATPRGSAVVLDLDMLLTLRNAGHNRIRAVTLRVISQEVALGGKASVAVPSLNVGPGEAFPLHVSLQLMRPGQMMGGPLVQVDLDGVLFQDLSFFGPDRLNSRRTMTAWEMEAQRDREYFRRILSQSGQEGLQRAMLASLARQAELPALDVRVSRGRATVSSAALPADRTEQFAFLDFPNAPIEPVNGWAQISGNEVSAPRISVRNQSSRPVKYVEIGWLVRDQSGRTYMAASLPSAESDLYLPPGKTTRVLQDTALKFTHRGEPVNIRGMTGFVNQVQFADGAVWVPNRQNLQDARLLGVMAPSPEEQRLSNLYRTQGINALIADLRKF